VLDEFDRLMGQSDVEPLLGVRVQQPVTTHSSKLLIEN
jgi:hypothetical protein